MAGMKKSKKVIILGIDGFDPKILEAMMGAGKLPHFSRLAATGGYSPLETIMPPQSPVVWTTIATGQPPAAHGIHDFLTRDYGEYLPKLAILKEGKLGYVRPFKAKTFWETASEQGRQCTILRWPLTFPARPINGTILTGLGTPDIRGTLGRYTFFTTTPGRGSSKGRVVKVDVAQHRIQTDLTGPYSLSFKGKKESSLPLEILIAADGHITCRMENTEFILREGTWSDWIRISFKIGFARHISGICKFYLESIAPDFNLYVTPINITNDCTSLAVSYPLNYGKRLAESIGPYATLGLTEDANGLNDEILSEQAFLSSCDQIMVEREKIFFHELARFEGGILANVFDTTDRIQHMFWRHLDAAHPLHRVPEAREFAGVIPGYYQRMDRILGRVLESLDQDTLVIVCSDHGFTSFRKSVHLNSWLVQHGFMALKDGKTAGGEIFADVDWSRTSAFAFGLNSLCLNIKNRERSGILEADQVPDLKAELALKLKSLTDEGRPVVQEVYDHLSFAGPSPEGQSPDLTIGYTGEYRSSWQTAVGEAPDGPVIEPNLKKWSGDHCCDPKFVPGIFLTNARNLIQSPHVKDICPAILDFLA
jgi:predicted AlkP superfamily phosphohydrolase/phosphomutase